MRLSCHSSGLLCLGSLLLCLCLPDAVEAQRAELEARRGFSGKQLFEHEWKWVPSSPDPIKGPLFVNGRRVSNEQRIGKAVHGDGLGPLHNGTSCAQCHAAGGGSGVDHNVTLISIDPRSPVVKEKGRGGRDVLEVFPGLVGPNGSLSLTTVVHEQSTRPGYPKIRQRLVDHVTGGIEDAWFTPSERTIDAIAKRPVVAGRYESVDFYLSQRNSPALFGLGIIDRINDKRIRDLARQQAKKSNGKITGRFVGKFGWRGQVNSLFAFVSQACATELGLSQATTTPMATRRTSARAPNASAGIVNAAVAGSPGTIPQPGDPADFQYVNVGADMSLGEVLALAKFISELPRPIETPHDPYSYDDTLAGERIFNSIGCVDCHVAELNHVSGIFSDLLLHDMGPELQGPDVAPVDPSLAPLRVMKVPTLSVNGPGFPSPLSSSGYYGPPVERQTIPEPYYAARQKTAEFARLDIPSSDEDPLVDQSWEVHQREWRTPPLWGVADTAPYLHDGRAATLDEAILWHGGEASESKERYVNLSAAEQELVVAFLSSLRAPDIEVVEAEE